MLKGILSFFSLLMATVLSATAESTVMRDREWVDQPVSAQAAEFNKRARGRFTMTPSPADKNLVVAYCESEEQWWGHLRVFKKDGDKIEWAAEFPEQYIQERGCYVQSHRWVKLKSSPHQVLEVLESTHMGNGSLWLLELEGRKFRVLLKAVAMGRFWTTDPEWGIPSSGEARFVSDLKVEYKKGGAITLEGDVSITDGAGQEIGVRGYRADYQWDKEKRMFLGQAVRAGEIRPVKSKP